ncbi:MAG: ATP-binding protein [Thermoleophilia bacterium]
MAETDAAALVEAVCDAVAERSPIPAPAVREVVENLVHAGFRDAVVTVLDGGRTVRVSDHGPGIADRGRALQPGYTTADDDDRDLILGVGGGLPFAAAALADLGGRLEIDDNLGGGTIVTLRLPADEGVPSPEPVCSGAAREILALLLEIDGASPARLAEELGRSRAECGRELARLEHRGLVRREPGGVRALTEAGTRLVATLF